MLALMIISITGCKSKHEIVKKKEPPVKETQTVVVSEEKQDTNQEEIASQAEEVKIEENGNKEATKQNVNEEEKQQVSTPKPQVQSPQTPQSETKPQGGEVTKPPENTKPEPPAQNTPTVPTTPNATANDNRAVADKVLEYINNYRSTPATKLPGLTVYAEYRSRQLIRNFAHDTFEERAAATALQYGTYIDPTLYGIEGEPYYEPGAREAIAKAGYAGSIDYVAKSIANLVKNSASHWAYVGSSDYSYIAVGVTYESGLWYCDIAVARENTDNK